MGKEASEDDPLAPNGPASGWSELAIDTESVRSGTHPRPFDPGDTAGRVVGDPFSGLDDGPLPDLELDQAPPDLPLPAPPPPRRDAPVPTAGVLAVDEVEVAALADYGEAPASFVTWVPYAILVTQRRMALKKSLAELRNLRGAADKDVKDSLVELGRALHARKDADGLRGLSAQLAACDETGQVSAGRNEAWVQAREAADAQRSSLAAKVQEAEKASGPYRDRETKLATQMSTRENDLRRVTARMRRVEIEIRNLRTTAAEGGAIDAPKLELLEAEIQARRADVEKAQGHVDELEPQLAKARKELAVMLSAINDLEKQRRAVDQAQDRTEKVHLSTAGEAEQRYHEAVEELARAAVERRIAEDVEPARARSVLAMQRALASREREIALHERALGAYDKAAFQKGWAVIAGAGLVVLVMLVLIAVR